MNVPALLLPVTGNVLGVLLLAMSGLQGPLLVLRPNSQSPLQLCLEIFYFYRSTQPLTYFYSSVTVHCKGRKMENLIRNHTPPKWWANLDQASKDLDKTIFRDLSPTPIP